MEEGIGGASFLRAGLWVPGVSGMTGAPLPPASGATHSAGAALSKAGRGVRPCRRLTRPSYRFSMRLCQRSVATPSFCDAPKVIGGWARREMPTVLHLLRMRLLGRRNLRPVRWGGSARPPFGAAGASALAAGGDLGPLSPVLLQLFPRVEGGGARVLLAAGRSVLNPGQPRGSVLRRGCACSRRGRRCAFSGSWGSAPADGRWRGSGGRGLPILRD